MLLAGCAAPRAPRALPPETVESVMSAYRGVRSEQTTALPHPFTLDAAKTVALRANPDLDAARARIAQAQAVAARAAAAFAPTLDANAGWTHTDQGANVAYGTVGGLPGFSPSSVQTDVWSIGLNAQYTLYDWDRRQHAYHAASREADLQAAARDDARRTLALAVAQAYFGVLLAQQDMVIAREDMTFNQGQAEVAQTRLDAGKGLETEVLNFQIRQHAAKARVVDASFRIATQKSLLLELMGLPQADAGSLTLQMPAMPIQRSGSAVPAMLRRPDLLALRHQRAQLADRLAAAQAEKKPVIAAHASAGLRYTDAFPSPLTDAVTGISDDRDVAAGITATWRLGDGGARDAASAEIEAQIAEVDARIHALRNRLIGESQRREFELDAARSQVQVQTEIVSLATRNRELELQLFEAGKSRLERLNTVQNDLVTAQQNLLRARLAESQRIEEMRATQGWNLPGESPPPLAEFEPEGMP